MSQYRQSPAVPANLPSGAQVIVAPAEAAKGTGSSRQPPSPRRGWLHYSHLKVEAAVFMLIALTFAAVLGEHAINGQKTVIGPKTPFYAYVYSDHDHGGTTTPSFDNARPLVWSCQLGKGPEGTYCAYGMSLDVSNTHKGIDLSKAQDIVIRMTYHGAGRRMKIMMKNGNSAELRKKIGADDDRPLLATFDVVDGQNEIHIRTDQLVVENWWIGYHHISPEDAKPMFDNVLAIAFQTGDDAHPGPMSASIQDITFTGAYMSTEQWYLLILGAWLVLTGAFLVYRFLHLRRGYEARQRQQAEESRVLAEAHAATARASAAKSQFLANMSHELRTPLNAVIGYAQLMRSGQLSPEQRDKAIGTIEHSGQHLLTMITDILDIAKVEAGKLELLPAPFDIRTCILSVAEMVRLRAEEKGLRFAVLIADGVPHQVVGDQKRIRQVIINLLTNAVKFTTEGEVRLEVSGGAGDDGQVHLRFVVADTGVGIPADQIGRIFHAFEQVGNAIDRSGGTGLGLSITQHIVDMMGGHIEVTSTPGEGSRFTVDMPFAGASDLIPDLTVPVQRLAAGTQRKILVVDDIAAVRDLLRSALEAQGYQVTEANNGREALERLQTEPCDLVIVDVAMPVMDGVETMRRLRADERTRAIPILALTANPVIEAEAEALAAGADRLLPKPVDLDVVAATIAQLLAQDSPAAVSDDQPMAVPDAAQMEKLLAFAREGNLRAIRREIPGIAAAGPQYKTFAGRLDALCAAYQSPAVLRLIEAHVQQRSAA